MNPLFKALLDAQALADKQAGYDHAPTTLDPEYYIPRLISFVKPADIEALASRMDAQEVDEHATMSRAS